MRKLPPFDERIRTKMNLDSQMQVLRSCCSAGISVFFSNKSSDVSRLAGEEGFEPSLTDPESAVLPLDDSPAHHDYNMEPCLWQRFRSEVDGKS